jgi:predicted permease
VKAFRAFLRRLTALARARQHERDLDEQIASHLAEATDDYIARGLSRDDASRAALRDFGGVTQTKQVHREVRSFTWPDNLRQDLQYTFRSLFKARAFTLVVVSTLALGIGVNIAMFTLLDAVVFKPLPVPAPHELVTLHENGPEGIADVSGGSGRFLRFSYPRFERLRQALGSDGSIAAVTRSSMFVIQLPGVTQAQFLQGQLVSGDYFSTLGVAAARGRTLTANDVRLDAVSPVAVVSDGFWTRALGANDNAIGQTINVNGVSVTIVGVMPPGFFGIWSDLEADVWLPVTLHRLLGYRANTSGYGRLDTRQTWLTQDLVAWVNLVARIPSSNLARVVAKLQAGNHQAVSELAAQLTDPDDRTAMLAHTLSVTPLAQGFSGLRSRYSDALFALTGLVVLVLLVTCANIANLLLARGAAQARDVSLRLSLGASTGRLVQQRLIESLTLAIIGGTAGVVVGTWASHLLAREVIGRSGDSLPIVFTPDSRVVMFATTVTLGTALLFGLAPALRTVAMGRRVSLNTTQRIAVGQMKKGGMRALVVGQLALSVVVVFAAVVLGRTLINVLRIDPGFPTDRLVVASLDPVTSRYTRTQMPALSQRLLDAVRAVPGVRSAATSMCGLLTGCSSSSPYRVEGAAQEVTLRQNWISPSYFLTTGIPLLSGREFHEQDIEGGAQVAIVNEAFVQRFFPGQNRVGRRLGREAVQPQDTRLNIEIVGVVRNARTQSLQELPEPIAYFPITQWGTFVGAGVSSLDIRADGDPQAIIAAVRNAIREAEPNLLLVDVSTMSARLSRHMNREHIVAYLTFSFAALTLLLASLGLYGVLSYGVARQTQEIGVRMALGARRLQVMRSVLDQSARLTIAGITLGLVAATAAAGYLSTMLFGVTPRDPWTFISVLIIFAAVTTLAAFVPARRATAIDPVLALRHE